MDRETASEYLPLVKALAEGIEVQENTQAYGCACWQDITTTLFDKRPEYYRIKPPLRRCFLWWPPSNQATFRTARAFGTADEANGMREIYGGKVALVTEKY